MRLAFRLEGIQITGVHITETTMYSTVKFSSDLFILNINPLYTNVMLCDALSWLKTKNASTEQRFA